jgi:hypothetical protein
VTFQGLESHFLSEVLVSWSVAPGQRVISKAEIFTVMQRQSNLLHATLATVIALMLGEAYTGCGYGACPLSGG